MTVPSIQSPELIAWLQALSTFFAFIALILSVIAVYFTVITFRMKKGFYVRGICSWSSGSVATNDPYVHEVVIENLKDRAIVIFGIYLKLGHGLTLTIERFDNEPLVIRPFEVYKKKYDPVDGYSFNMKRVRISDIIDYKENYSLILSTTDGLIKAKKPPAIKNPTYDWFKNHLAITLETDRTNVNGKSYGGATKYVVEVYEGSEIVERIALYGDDHKYAWFRDIGGKLEDLDSESSVKNLFESVLKDKGFENRRRVEVIDYAMVLHKRYEGYILDPTVLKKRSWIIVHGLGRLLTAIKTRKMIRENRMREKERKKKMIEKERKKK